MNPVLESLPTPAHSTRPVAHPGRSLARSGARASRRLPAGASLLVLFILASLAGCNSSPALPPLSPVTGSVSAEDKPVTSGQVTLVALTKEDAEKAPPSSGQIDESGTYTIQTAGKPGAPLGKYKVVVNPSMVPMAGAKSAPKAAFNDKYRQVDTTTLVIEVVASPAAGAYNLKLKK
jgi:hypothetical protein